MRINETWEDIKNSADQKFNKEQVIELVKELKDNYTPEKRNEVVMALHPLIIKIVESVWRRNELLEQDKEDLYIHLCDFVIDLLDKNIESMIPETAINYINTSIVREYHKFLDRLKEVQDNEISAPSILDSIDPETTPIGNVWVENVIKFILDKKLISERDLHILLLSAGLIDGNEWTEKEIAEQLGLPVGTVSSVLSRKARELRKKLKNMRD